LSSCEYLFDIDWLAKYNEAKNGYEAMKGDLDKMSLKVQFLEAKLEKNYHLEGLFT
jgi:hypothetical protein